MDRNQRADPLIQQTVVFKNIRMKSLNSTGYGTSRFGPSHRRSPDLANHNSLLEDQSSSILFTMGHQNRPFSTQGFNNDFKIGTSLGNPMSGRNSTLEPMDHQSANRTPGVKKGGRANKGANKQMWKSVGKT